MTVLVIDDLRVFRDKRDAVYVRNSREAISYLKSHADESFDEIWLDHDLGVVDGVVDSIMPVVDYLCEQAFNDVPVSVGVFCVHTSNPVGSKQIMASLARYGYPARQVYAGNFFVV